MGSAAQIDQQSSSCLSWRNIMLLHVSLLLVLVLVPDLNARPQDADCAIFDTCGKEDDTDCAIFDTCGEEQTITAPEQGDEIFGCDAIAETELDQDIDLERAIDLDTRRSNCFDSINEIDSLENDGRNVFNDCNTERKCIDFASEGYSCANAWNCNENNTIITDGKGLIDVRSVTDFTLDLSDHKCDKEDQICCKRPNYRVERPNRVKRVEDKEEEEVVEEIVEYSKCGRSPKSQITLTGLAPDQAQIAEFPHMCVLFRTQKDDQGRDQHIYIGGASLIARNKVLTVAHKFNVVQDVNNPVDYRDMVKQFSIRCGEYNVKEEHEIFSSQESRVEEVYFHPQYDNRKLRNNIAIVRTKENFLYQEHIGPTCLPRPWESFENPRKSKDCWSSGWGADSYEESALYSDGLRKVKLPLFQETNAKKDLNNTDRFAGRGFRLHESWMCIGGTKGNDTCKGDGGSPHVCKTEKGWTQIGAVAWGIDCGNEVPAVYSSVPYAMCWIDWVMSCVGESERNVENLFANLFDIRGSDDAPQSINGLSGEDCQGWMDENPELANRCQVQYISIDQRTTG